MLFFTTFCMITSNKMLSQILHTSNSWLSCCIVESTQNSFWWVKCTMGNHRSLWWALQMCHFIIPGINVVTDIFCYYWTWYQCTSTWNRSNRWPQLHWQKFYFPINFKCATAVWKSLWHTDGYSHCNTYIWCWFGQIILKHIFNAENKHGGNDQSKYKNWQVNKIRQKVNILFKRILMLRKVMLKCFVIQTSFYHCHFVIHSQNHMVSEVWVSIIIFDLTQNWDMEYAQYAVYMGFPRKVEE